MLEVSQRKIRLAGACLNAFKPPADISFVVSGGQGAEVWDCEGKRYIDYLLGSGPMVLGHAHPSVVAAIAEQAARGTHFYFLNDRAIELAEQISRLIPCAESVRFCSDGSEATFYALRIARAFTGKRRVLKFDGAFHGHHDYAKQQLAGTGIWPESAAETAGIPETISDTVLVAPFNDLDKTKAIARATSDIAAILVEPIQRCLLPQPGFLEGLRDLANEIGALLIFDEVVTGFRVALGGAQQLYNVTPDLCALGKVLGGGTPLAAVAGRADIMELTDPTRRNDGRSVYMSGTLNGNPLSCAAGLATLQVIEELDGPKSLARKGESLAEGLRSISRDLSVQVQLLGAPGFLQVVFGDRPVSRVADLQASNMKAATEFGMELMRRRVLVYPGSKLYISLAHDDGIQSRFLDAAGDALRAIRDNHLLEPK